MYKNFIREFNASIEALSKEKIAFSDVVNRYIANQKDFFSRTFEAWRDHVLSEIELETLQRYMSDETEKAVKTHLENAIKNERHE